MTPVLSTRLKLAISLPSGFGSSHCNAFAHSIPQTKSRVRTTHRGTLTTVSLANYSLKLTDRKTFNPSPDIP